MADTHETIADIIAEARDEYTVHNCNQCNYRKSCDLNTNGFDSDECRGRRQSIMLGFGIEDGYFTKILDRLDAALKRERGDAAKLREAVKAVVDVGYPHNFQIEPPHIRGYCYDITKAIKKCFAALAAPPRNCDVGTAEVQLKRKRAYCKAQGCRMCPFYGNDSLLCAFRWAQGPYEEEGAK